MDQANLMSHVVTQVENSVTKFGLYFYHGRFSWGLCLIVVSTFSLVPPLPFLSSPPESTTLETHAVAVGGGLPPGVLWASASTETEVSHTNRGCHR